MIDAPKTKQEARKIRYNQWAGSPKGNPYIEGRCAYEVWHNMLQYQCSRFNGHGPDQLYCKQHAKIVERK